MSQPVGCSQVHGAAVQSVTKGRDEVVTLCGDWSPSCGRSGFVATQWWAVPSLPADGVTLPATGTGWAQVALGTPGLIYSVIETAVVMPAPTGFLPSVLQRTWQVYVQPLSDPSVGTPCACP